MRKLDKIKEIISDFPINPFDKKVLIQRCSNKKFRKALSKDFTKEFKKILRKIPKYNRKKRKSYLISVFSPEVSYKDELGLNILFYIQQLIEREIRYKIYLNMRNLIQDLTRTGQDLEFELERYTLITNADVRDYPNRSFEQFPIILKNKRNVIYNLVMTVKQRVFPNSNIILENFGLDLENKIFYCMAFKGSLKKPLGLVKLENIISPDVQEQFEKRKDEYMSNLFIGATKRLENLSESGRNGYNKKA